MPYQNLDLRQDSQYNLILNKDRTLNVNITAQIYSGNTLVDFDFSSYSAATMQIRTKPDASYVMLQFSTTDGSIILPATGGTFNLNKTATQLANIRAGEFYYDMYLSSTLYPKRAFLSGTITILPNITT